MRALVLNSLVCCSIFLGIDLSNRIQLQLTDVGDWLGFEVRLAAGGGGLGLEMVAGWPVGGCIDSNSQAHLSMAMTWRQ